MTTVDVVYTGSVQLTPSYWRPLPDDELQDLVVGAALDALSRQPSMRVVRAARASREGNLQIHLTLLGKTQAVEASLSLFNPAFDDVSANASVSLAGLDDKAARAELRHLGTAAAEHLAALVTARLLGNTPVPGVGDAFDLQQRYEAALTLKEAGRYHDAHVSLQSIARQEGTDAGVWPELARDELSYGLPVFRAQQLLNRSYRDNRETMDALTEAEQLLRHAAMENAGNVSRRRETQALLDEVQLVRAEQRNTMRSAAAVQAQSFRLALNRTVMAEEHCPEAERVSAMVTLPPLQLRRTTGLGKLKRYYLTDTTSGYETVLECDANRRTEPVRVIE